MLMQRNGSPFWYAIYLTATGRRVWKSTCTEDKAKARKFHDQLVAKEWDLRRQMRWNKALGMAEPEEVKQAKRIKLEQAWEKYLSVVGAAAPSQVDIWRRFSKWCEGRKLSYVDQLDAPTILKYLAPHGGKTYNTYKSALNKVFKNLGIFQIENPLENLPSRETDSKKYRAFSGEEIAKLLQATEGSFWHDAILVALHTGLRKEDIALLTWASIRKGAIDTIPGKTAKKGRAVYVPIHPAIAHFFETPGEDSAYVFPECAKRLLWGSTTNTFAALLKSLKIADTDKGKASFRSLRATFITRCEEAGVSRKVLQGIVGHRSPSMTEHYSEDRVSSEILRRITLLPIEQPRGARNSGPNKTIDKNC